MIVGDTLVCKREIQFRSLKFVKDKSYKIHTIDLNRGKIDSIYIDCLGDKSVVDNFGLWFHINEDITIKTGVTYYIYDYFYTQEEIRKLKLDSL